MPDIIYNLSTKAGISPDMARKGMGAILEMCKSRLSPEAYSKVSDSLPDADAMIASSQPSPDQQASGGMISSITGAIGKAFGGGSGELVSKLSAIGFSTEQLKGFLPPVFEFLKQRVPSDALKRVSEMLPN